MKKNDIKIEERYQAPEITVLELRSEGVLCSSFEPYDEETLEW